MKQRSGNFVLFINIGDPAVGQQTHVELSEVNSHAHRTKFHPRLLEKISEKFPVLFCQHTCAQLIFVDYIDSEGSTKNQHHKQCKVTNPASF